MNAHAIRLAGLALLAVFAIGRGDAVVPEDPVTLVDPLLGVDGGGNVLPGATVPFGFVTVGPQTTNGDTSGYDSTSPVVGFANTFVSGTGGASKYGNFRTTPTIGAIEPNHLAFARSDEAAAPGYYGVTLGKGPDRAIRADFTATRLIGLHRYTFPASAQSNVLIDVTSAILMGGDGQIATGAEIAVVDDHTLSGWASFKGGWNPAPYKLYFRVSFDRPAVAIGTWRTTLGTVETREGIGRVSGGDQTARPRAAPALSVGVSYPEGGDARGTLSDKFGAFARFDTRTRRTVQMKLAVSFVSEAKAGRSMEEEAPGWAFDARRADAATSWRAALAPIRIAGGTRDQRQIFYSSLYRVHTMPHDLTGENAWWTSDEPHYEDFYTLWDTFRTVTPLMTLIHPQRQRDIVRSLIDTYRHTGWLPDARIAGANGMTQGGSNGDVVIADAIVKGLGGFDAELGYAAIKHDGDDESPDPINVGRSLRDYLRIGYVPIGQTRSASRTMEYAYDDYAISAAAAALGKGADARRFRDRARNWRNLWDPRSGCIRPRYADGRWLENFDCAYRYPDRTTLWWEAPFYEGSGLQYATFVPHDLPCLIAKVGGRSRYVAWLDRFFDGGHYEQGNEPSFLAAFNYIAAGRPDRAAERVRAITTTLFRTGRRGLPGNDDAGAMSAWYVWNAIGLYPNAGQPYYFIGSPIFSSATIALEDGRHFTISAPTTSAANRYVTGATLNGKLLDRAWITHDELAAGGTLRLTMGPRPGQWATSPAAAPPAPMPLEPTACSGDPEHATSRGHITMIRAAARTFAPIALAALLAGTVDARPADPLAPTGRWSGFTGGRAATPPMGWSSWNAFGTAVDEEKVIGTAKALVDTGLATLGYRYVNIDDGWWLRRRQTDGRLIIRTAIFPSAATGGPDETSFRPLTDRLHAMGLRAGIYTDIGRNACSQQNRATGRNLPEGSVAEREVGSYGHAAQDASLFFKEWGFDYLKVDGCGLTRYGPDEPLVRSGVYRALPSPVSTVSINRTDIPRVRALYMAMGNAIAAARPDGDYVYSICLWGAANVRAWGKDVGNAVRSSDDIRPNWTRMLHNFDSVSHRAFYAHPGSWNDPDMLFIGHGDFDAAHLTEARSHFALWAIMNAPLLIGYDMRQAPRTLLDIWGNADLVRANQDPAGNQGVIAYDSEDLQIVVKTLGSSDRKIVAVFNRGLAPADVTLLASQMKFASDVPVRLRDIWTGRTLAPFTGSRHLAVAPRETLVFEASGTRALPGGLYLSEMPGRVNPARDGVVVPQADPAIHRMISPWTGTLDSSRPIYAGWGGVGADENPYGQAISIAGTPFATGVGILANSRLEVRSDGQFSTFAARVGIDDNTLNTGVSATFLVYGDGRLLARSRPMKFGDLPQPISANVRGVRIVELVVRQVGEPMRPSATAWADAALLR